MFEIVDIILPKNDMRDAHVQLYKRVGHTMDFAFGSAEPNCSFENGF